MASAFIVPRRLSSGGRRYEVRYRLGGQESRIRYAGRFKTRREAEARQKWIAGELAARRVPDLRSLEEIAATRGTFAQVADRYLESRLDYGETTRKDTRSHLKRLMPAFGDRDPASITPGQVQAWIADQAAGTKDQQALKPASISRYLATLRQILDFAHVDPNPARDRSVRLPRIVREEPQPPTRAEFAAIIENVPPVWRLPLRVLEATGMRIGELSDLRWGDVDERESRFRVSRARTKGKTAGQRWVQVPPPLMAEVSATCPPDDRTRERAVFPRVTADGAKNVMARACVAAGISHYHPHDLRHRRLSLWHAQGVPARELAERAGHSRASMSLDIYGHVVLAGDDEWA